MHLFLVMIAPTGADASPPGRITAVATGDDPMAAGALQQVLELAAGQTVSVFADVEGGTVTVTTP